MTNRPIHEYEITVKVQRKFLLTIPVADIHVCGRLDPRLEFGQQIANIFNEHLARIQAKLEKARTS
jgi:hypothetical protein